MIRRILMAAALLLAVAHGWAQAADGAQPRDVNTRIGALLDKGDAIVAAYDPQARHKTASAFSDLYFDDFEGGGLEAAIGLANASLKDSLESQFGQVIGKARVGAPAAALAETWAGLRTHLAEVPSMLDAGKPRAGFWATFLQSFLILMREGFEAMLVVTALAAYLRRSAAADKVRVVYQGVGLALLASLLTAWAFSSLISMSGQGQEVMEGGTMLVAAVVLFYCSYWLFAKREAARWQRYVQERIDQALSGGRLFALGFAAFLAVFREGAETVLFYQALAAGSPGQMTALLSGLASAVAALAVVYIAMQGLSLRLPLGWFFAGTAALLYYLALAFAGKGVVELQNGKILPITPLDGWPSIEWLGLYPTAEGAVAQAVLVVPLAGGLLWWVFKRNAARKVSPT